MKGIKNALLKVFESFGYYILPKSSDPVLQELLLVYRQLRTSASAIQWQHRLAKVASLGHLKNLLHIHQIQTVVDVGANIGQFGLSLRKAGFKGIILSFEPMHKARSRLESVAVKNPPWKVFPIALGSKAEKKKLQIFNDDTFSSLYSVTAEGKKIFGPYVEAHAEEVVKIETLDRLFLASLNHEIQGPVLLKTDTQGHDLEVLQGGVEFLKKTSAVLTEAAVEVIYEGAPAFTEILQFLEHNEFEASGFYPISHRSESLTMIEFDAFYVKKTANSRNRSNYPIS